MSQRVRLERAGRHDLSIVSWNVESARRFSENGPEVLRHLRSPDVLCVQETRLRSTDAAELRALETALPGYDCFCACANDPRNATFRGGRLYGVALFVRKTLHATALDPPEWDREGRVVGARIDGLGLAVFSVYAVNGTDKPFFDHALGRTNGDRHQWKQRFHSLFVAHAARVKGTGLNLVLAGDWNVSRAAIDTTPRLRTEEPHASARAQFNDWLMPTLDVVDVFREQHPAARAYTWFNARSRRLDAARVDFILVSRELATAARALAWPDEADRMGSDHAPIGVALAFPPGA